MSSVFFGAKAYIRYVECREKRCDAGDRSFYDAINIAFGLLFNLVSVVAGASGVISPIMGAVVHNVGSVLVVLSSASLALMHDKSA